MLFLVGHHGVVAEYLINSGVFSLMLNCIDFNLLDKDKLNFLGKLIGPFGPPEEISEMEQKHILSILNEDNSKDNSTNDRNNTSNLDSLKFDVRVDNNNLSDGDMYQNSAAEVVSEKENSDIVK